LLAFLKLARPNWKAYGRDKQLAMLLMTGEQSNNSGRLHDSEIQKRDTDERAAPASTAESAPHKQDGRAAGPKKRPAALLGSILLIALLACGALYYWLSTRNIESTDDAYTDGRAITIAPQVSGTVVSLDVTDNEFVHKGQPLIHIDPRQYVNDQTYAQGVLDTAKSQLAALTYGAEIAPRISLPDFSKRKLSSARRKPRK